VDGADRRAGNFQRLHDSHSISPFGSDGRSLAVQQLPGRKVDMAQGQPDPFQLDVIGSERARSGR
jgi:hypothetical protein